MFFENDMDINRGDVSIMNEVRFGIVGIGGIGTLHSNYLLGGEVTNARLTAVCDIDEQKLIKFKEKHGDEIARYVDYKDLLASGKVDAVIIATPHYMHPVIAIDAFHAGLNVLVEKPAGVYAKKVLEMNEAAKESGKVFSIMYCMRTDPYYIKIRDMLQTGELGTLKRINWIATDWYRPQSYHNSCAWRSSWAGEGGGVIINQCPHNLDLWQWMFGMPESLCAFADFGKYYDIEVEDDVTVYMRYPNGVTGVFIASTGEAPGTNRLEITGTLGKLTYEKGKLIYMRNREDERSFNQHFTSSIAAEPEKWVSEVEVTGTPMQHKKITQNFVNAILHGEELIAPGENGINEMNLSNGIHYSAWTDQKVTLPVDNAAYLELLRDKINRSSRTAKVREGSGQTECI